MKAKHYVFAAAAILLCATFFSACGSAADDLLGGTYNQWYKYNGTAEISFGTSDDDNADESGKLKNVEVYFRFNPSTGLTVALQASRNQNVTVLGVAETDVDLTIGETKDYTLEQFGQGKWMLLYSTGKLEKTGTPKVVSDPDSCIKLSSINDFKFQWKKVLANFILNNLLGE